jgi:hypothetical protein
MSDPTFLPLLNTIAVNECKGEILLNAWAEATNDESLAAALRFVAIREGEHAWAFTKRMCELGYPVSEDDAFQVFQDFDGLLECLSSTASDQDKIRTFNAGLEGDGSDPFAAIFQDTSIDPQTGGLLGRYIAEERDSGRRLQVEYQRISATASSSPSELAELRACIEALRAEIQDLKRLRTVA